MFALFKPRKAARNRLAELDSARNEARHVGFYGYL